MKRKMYSVAKQKDANYVAANSRLQICLLRVDTANDCVKVCNFFLLKLDLCQLLVTFAPQNKKVDEFFRIYPKI